MRIRLATLAALAALSVAGAASGQPKDAPRLTDAELAQQRGGVLTPMGYDIGFAADVRTYVDGSLALETRLSWTDAGPVTERIGDLGAVTGGGLPSDSPWSLILPGVGGDTRVLHDVGAGRIASVIANSASGRDIRQDTDIRLVIPQLPELQAQLAAGRLASSIGGSVGQALAQRTR